MPRSYTNLIYHIVFSTKDRRPLITSDRQERLYEYIGGIIRNLGGISLGINGVEDHAHVLAKLRPDKSVSEVLRDLKANSSGWMHDVFPNAADFAWQNGYGAFTVSSSQVESVRKYIADQEIHHAERSFEDEFIGLLTKNEIEFDRKYYGHDRACETMFFARVSGRQHKATGATRGKCIIEFPVRVGGRQVEGCRYLR